MVDLVRGADFAARYLLSALSVGEPRRIAQALVLETGHAASQAPSSRRTRALVERLERLDRSLDDPRAHASTMLAKAFRDYFLNAWPFALSRSDEAEKAFRERCGGVPWEMWTARTVAIWSLFYLGQWRELERRVDAQLNEARDRGNLYAMTATRVPHGVMAWLVRDDSAGARRNVAEAMADWSVGAFDLQHYWFLMAETYLDLYARNGLEAWERLRERWPSLVRSLLLRVPMVQAEMLMARGSGALAAATAERGRSHGALLREAENAARRLERVHVPMCRPLAALLRTGIAAQHGRSEQAARGLEAVLPELERLQMAGYAAAARRQLAALIGASAPEFLPSERVVDPAAITRMLAPGFAEA